MEVVKYLCEKYPLTIEDIGNKNSWALIWAFRMGHKEVVKYLCETYSLTIEDIRRYSKWG